MLTYGLTSVTFRKKTVDEIIKITVENRLTSIEWGGDVHVPPHEISLAAEVGQKTRAAGLTVCSYGSYYRLGQPAEDFQKVSAAAKALGTDRIRIWAGEKASRDTGEEEYLLLVQSFQQACDIAAASGQTVCLEFHKNTYNDTAETGRKLLEAARRGNAKTYWQPIYDRDTELRNIRALAPYLTNIHLFHWDKNGKRFPLQKGDVWGVYAAALATLGGEHPVLFEFVKHDSPRQLKKDVKALHQWFGC